MDVNKIVVRESKKLREKMSSLLSDHEGEWVLFRDGRAIAFFPTEDQAYAAGLQHFGLEGGFVVDLIQRDRGPTPITASVSFGVIK